MKLLRYVDRRARSGFDYHGCFLRPGSIVGYKDLHPSSDYPETAVLLEYAGAPRAISGWRRHMQGDVWLLWRQEADGWVEVARVCTPADEWAELLRDAARRALEAPTACPGEVRSRIRALIEAELAALSDAEQYSVVALLHDEFASRMSVGRQVGPKDVHTYPPGLRVLRK